MCHGINLIVDSVQKDSSNGAISSHILDSCDAEAFMLLAQHRNLNLWNQHVNIHTSSMNLFLSNVIMKHVSAVSEFISNTMRSFSETQCLHESEKLEPRLSLFAGISLRTLCIEVQSLSLSLIIEDEADNILHLDPLSLNEIILEESLTDFLSQIACFDLTSVPQKSIDASTRLCVDRLCSLGLSSEKAQFCVSSALTSFLDELDHMRSSQSEIIEISTESFKDLHPDRKFSSFTSDLSDKRQVFQKRKSLTHIDSPLNSEMFEKLQTSEKRKSFTYTDEHFIDDVATVGSVTSFDGSEESMNIIETTMKHIVERTISTVVDSLRPQTNHRGSRFICIELASGFNISLDQFFYDWEFSIELDSFVIKTNRGINIMKMTPSHSSSQVLNNSPVKSSSAIHLATKLHDFKDNFGGGGEELSILASDTLLHNAHGYRSQALKCDVFFGLVEVVFSYIDVYEFIDTVDSLCEELKRKEKYVPDNSISIQRKDNLETSIFSANIGQITILLCSDNLQPFTSFAIQSTCVNMTFDNANRKKYSTIASVTSNSVTLNNLTPQGQFFSDVVYQNDNAKSRSSAKVLSLELFISHDSSKHPSELKIDLSGFQIFVLRQYINEFIQYTSNKDYGLGKLLEALKNTCEEEPDKTEKLSMPLKYNLLVQKSCLIIPRNSRSVEITAVEFDKIKFSGSFHSSPWQVPVVSDLQSDIFAAASRKSSYDFEDDLIQNNSRKYSNVTSSYIPTDNDEEDFFDCLENDNVFDPYTPKHYNATREPFSDLGESEGETPFGGLLIPRFTITLLGARIFCGCSTKKFWKESEYEEDISSISNYLKLGRVKDGLPIFVQIKPFTKVSFSSNFSTLIDDVLARKWEEITLAPIGLRIVIEYSSHIRILIDDLVSNKKYDNPFSVCLRMSQFYLLLSIWYSNMQELPISFPYSDDQILKGTEMLGCPLDWPEYGSDDFVKRMKSHSMATFEMAISLHKLQFLCTFDVLDYFKTSLNFASVFQKKDTDDVSQCQALTILSSDCVVHLHKDNEGLFRLGCGANSLQILDGRVDKSGSPFAYAVEQTDDCGSSGRIHGVPIDLSFGLDFGHHTMLETIDLPFKLSLFLTPDRWCLINLGLQSINAMASNLSTIWILLEYFGNYFKDENFGNESFPASELFDSVKDDASLNNRDIPEDVGCINIDFRLCLLNPHVAIPANVIKGETQYVILDCHKGFYYRYKSISYTYSSQEICSKDLRILINNIFMREKERHLSSDQNGGQNVIITGLSFGIQYDFDEKTNHLNFSLTIPLNLTSKEKGLKGIESPPLQVQPLILSEPTICKPIFQPLQNLGVNVCNITLNPHKLLLVSRVLYNLVTGPNIPDRSSCIQNGSPRSILNTDEKDSYEIELTSDDRTSVTFGVTVNLSGARFYISDPALGMHLPVLVICIPSLELIYSKARIENSTKDSPAAVKNNDLQACVNMHMWIDYFKSGLTRSWEPLLEPYHSIILYEESFDRGKGISISSECPFHFNITGALFDTLDDAIDLSSDAWRDFNEFSNLSEEKDFTNNAFVKNISNDESVDDSITSLDVTHRNLRSLESRDRVAYSILNLTGERIRYHQKSSTPSKLINYLENLSANELKFPATRSVARNLKMVEIPLDSYDLEKVPSLLGDYRVASHLVDIHIVGFSWIKGVSIDEHGRHFEDLVPRSQTVQVNYELRHSFPVSSCHVS